VFFFKFKKERIFTNILSEKNLFEEVEDVDLNGKNLTVTVDLRGEFYENVDKCIQAFSDYFKSHPDFYEEYFVTILFTSNRRGLSFSNYNQITDEKYENNSDFHFMTYQKVPLTYDFTLFSLISYVENVTEIKLSTEETTENVKTPNPKTVFENVKTVYVRASQSTNPEITGNFVREIVLSEYVPSSDPTDPNTTENFLKRIVLSKYFPSAEIVIYNS
jgi:hypothetical protein